MQSAVRTDGSGAGVFAEEPLVFVHSEHSAAHSVRVAEE